MADLYADKNIKPMLIGAESEAFDSPEWVYELKLDGERAVVYVDPRDGTELRNKRNKRMLPLFPELSELHRQTKKRCILDGEYIVLKDGRPDFFSVQRRSLLSNPFKIELASAEMPVTFVAFDILYLEDRPLLDLPLMERKKLLSRTVSDGERMAVSRVIEERGVDFYRLVEQQQLEGIVAKRKDSLYYQGKRTKEWVKIKRMLDEDYVIVGYIRKPDGMNSLVLAQYDGDELVYQGHVTLGVSGRNFRRVAEHPRAKKPAVREVPKGNENAVWIVPDLVCTVEYMPRKDDSVKCQPVFKGLREDKLPEECRVPINKKERRR